MLLNRHSLFKHSYMQPQDKSFSEEVTLLTQCTHNAKINVYLGMIQIIGRLSFIAQIRDKNAFGFAKSIHNKLMAIKPFRSLLPSEIDICRISGGSNYTFKVTTNTHKYALRIVRRIYDFIAPFYRFEGQNISQTQHLYPGLNLVYSDKQDGTLLTEFIEDGRVLLPKDFNGKNSVYYMRKFVDALKKLHFSKIKFSNTVDVFERILGVYSEVQKKAYSLFPEHMFSSLRDRILSLKSVVSIEETAKKACHNDASPYNAILSNTKLILIDWERSGNNDPAWDLAYLSISSKLSTKQQEIMLQLYCDNNIDQTLKARVFIYIPVIEFWKALWILFQVQDGNDIIPAKIFIDIAKQKLNSSQKLTMSPKFQWAKEYLISSKNQDKYTHLNSKC